MEFFVAKPHSTDTKILRYKLMAIPYFFSFIKKEFSRVVIPVNRPLKCDALYIDSGTILHNLMLRCQKEDQLLQVFVEFLHLLMLKCGPQKLLYIAFDGVPPFAKLQEQAIRRQNTITSYGLNPHMISPGTQFMVNFTKKLEKVLKSLASRKAIEVVVSKFSEPGEGEQKIFQYVKKHPNWENVVYGNDADLILLGLLSPVRSVKILRELSKTRYESIPKKKFEIVSIHRFKGELISLYSAILKNHFSDVVLMMIIMGNDFLPQPYRLNINLDFYRLIGCVEKCLQQNGGKAIVDQSGNIDSVSFEILLDILYEYRFSSFQKEWESDIHQVNRDFECQFAQKIKISKDCASTDNLLKQKYDLWRAEQYLKWQNKEMSEIKEISQDYLEGLQWVVKYYVSNNWTEHWIYRHNIAPDFPELRALGTIKKPQHQAVPMKPLHQLALILPFPSRNLLPHVYECASVNVVKELDSFDKVVKEICRFRSELDPHLSEADCERNLDEDRHVVFK